MQPSHRVLLRKSSDGRYVEIGELIERIRGKTWRLLSENVEVEHDLQPGDVSVLRGTMRYRLLIEPRVVESQLGEAPASVFRQLLGESPKGAKASQLKDALHGLDRRLIDKGWDRAKKELDASDDVRRSASRVPTYMLASPAAREMTRLATHSPVREPTVSAPVAPVGVAATDGAGLQQTSAAAEDHGPPQGGLLHPASGIAASTSEHSDPLVDFLSHAGLIDAHEDLGSLARQPLSLALTLNRLKGSDLRALLPTLEARHRILLATVMGSGKERLLQDDVILVRRRAYEATLRAGLGEIARAARDRGRLLSPLAALLERATAAYAIEPELLVELARAFAVAKREGSQGLDRSLEALARHVDSSAASRSDVDMLRVAKAARQAEFSRTGGRSFLVATLYRQVPERARDEAWWEGASFDQLAEAGHGPLAAAMQDTQIAKHVVRPLVEEALRDTETRNRLAQIISAPAPLARWAAGDELKAALLRTGNRDEVASSWAEVLTDTRELARMEAQLSAARAEVTSNRVFQQDLQRRIAHLEHRLQVTGEELAAARGAQTDARGVHDRQTRADLVRVVARMAAQVSQSTHASQDVTLLRSIGHATAREGLEPIGQPGATVSFDPAKHDSMDRMISPEADVTVVRPGYTWRDGTDAVVVVKAQVVPDGE